MATVQGVVSPAGVIVRRQGQFTVVSRSTTTLVIKMPGQNLRKAFVLATPWRDDGDIGPTEISASPNPLNNDQMIFAVDGYYGVSFRIQT